MSIDRRTVLIGAATPAAAGTAEGVTPGTAEAQTSPTNGTDTVHLRTFLPQP